MKNILPILVAVCFIYFFFYCISRNIWDIPIFFRPTKEELAKFSIEKSSEGKYRVVRIEEPTNSIYKYSIELSQYSSAKYYILSEIVEQRKKTNKVITWKKVR